MSYDLRARICALSELSSTEKLVMHTLAHHKNDKSGRCDPSLKLLMHECSLSNRGLLNVLQRLEERRFIEIERGGGQSKPSQYNLFPNPLTVNVVHPLEPEKKQETVNGVHSSAQLTVNVVPTYSEPDSTYSERRSKHIRTEPEEPLLNGSSSTTTSPRSVFETPDLPKERSAAVADLEVPEVLALSLCEACALMPDALGEKHRRQLLEVATWLLSLYPDPEEAAHEVAVRFSAWDRPTPPHLPQIKTDWKRMERIIQHQTRIQNVKPNTPETAGDRRARAYLERRAEGAH